jgi:ferredoxin
MADTANKYPENATGKYYVDNQCIDCDLCRETAPENFKRNDDGGYSVVYKQPGTPEEEARCKEAKEGCPVEAIGDNGPPRGRHGSVFSLSLYLCVTFSH